MPEEAEVEQQPLNLQSFRRLPVGDSTSRQHPYTEPEELLKALESGEVILVKSSWWLERARAGKKVPCRQEIEAHYPAAIMTADMVRAGMVSFKEAFEKSKGHVLAKNARSDYQYWAKTFVQPKVIPILAISRTPPPNDTA